MGRGRLKVMLVGCGVQGEKHLRAYLEMGDVDLVVCEASEARLKELKARYPQLEYVSDFYEAVDQLAGELDAVDICTPTKTHYKLVMAALKADLHVFCEKPLVPSAREAREIADEAGRRGLQVMVGFLMRFHPAMRRVKELLDSGRLGRPHFAFFRIGGRGGRRRWKHLREEHGGAVLEMMLHGLDLALWFFGELGQVEAVRGDIVLRERVVEGELMRVTAEDYALCCLRSGSDMEILCEADMFTPSYVSYVEVLGEKGNVFASIMREFPCLLFLREEGKWLPLCPDEEGEGVGLVKAELRYFVDRLARGEPVQLSTAEDFVKVMEVADEVRRRIYAQLGTPRGAQGAPRACST